MDLHTETLYISLELKHNKNTYKMVRSRTKEDIFVECRDKSFNCNVFITFFENCF
jgi:hypothetical protein